MCLTQEFQHRCLSVWWVYKDIIFGQPWPFVLFIHPINNDQSFIVKLQSTLTQLLHIRETRALFSTRRPAVRLRLFVIFLIFSNKILIWCIKFQDQVHLHSSKSLFRSHSPTRRYINYAIEGALLNKHRIEGHFLLGCEDVKSRGSLMMFQKNALPQFSGSKNNKTKKQTSKQHG
jgi:hypothetical protein